MKASDHIVKFLIDKGITDVFGVPGGVVLDFLYSLDRQKDIIMPHLGYNEQSSIFAACGYAQASNKLGVAYATKGPGITNMVSGVAEAYADSIPILVITGHVHPYNINTQIRMENEQEIDTVTLFSKITKYIVRIERVEEIEDALTRAYLIATTNRKGPVVLDILSNLFSKETLETKEEKTCEVSVEQSYDKNILADINDKLNKSKRPILLIGDGIRQSGVISELVSFAETNRLPVLSSRCSQDIMPKSDMYYGYIGSHGIRYSNFILSKCDLIISLGNRMAFSPESKSFSKITKNAKIIRVDIDKNEFFRYIPNSANYLYDLNILLSNLCKIKINYIQQEKWLNTCNILKEKLWNYDCNLPVDLISEIIGATTPDTTLVCDVGNHEFWVSRAYIYSKNCNRIIYSKTYGTLGSALGRAIGSYYSTRNTIICFIGDQGFQFNIQELQFITNNKLPIIIVLLNNHSSGMIRSREKQKYSSHFVHTTIESGYGVPDFKKVALAYGFKYYNISERILSPNDIDHFIKKPSPIILELQINEAVELSPFLPIGEPCQNLYPQISKDVYSYLNEL